MYCLDTYALWEIYLGNEKFLHFFEQKFIITEWTLIEFYKTLVREFNKETADYWIKRLLPYTKNVSLEIAFDAVFFQSENKSEKMSLFNCIGYQFSVKNNLLFVTGDKAFKNKKNVFFIKK